MSDSIHILYDPVAKMICTFCHARMDVSSIAPFSKAICPSCGNEVTVPARLGSFLLTELLGTGGMGGVYRAHDETLGRDVAIKVMLKSLGNNPEFVTTFRREAQAAAKLNHPNIAQIYSFGQEKGQPYIVMELVPGMHFDQMIAAPEPLDIPTVMKIGQDIAEGLQMAAEANLIHGDIKPENILLDERNQAKLVDFGIAAKPSSGEGEIWGTPYYIAPERVRRQRVDFRSDIYCLGGTLYHAITQHPPFEGADALEVVRARLKGPPVPLEKHRPDVDPEVTAIIMRMLQAEPAMRYPTYGSLLSDMRKYLARVQPRMQTRSTGRRIVIKGRKAATEALSAPSATRQMPQQATTGGINGSVASRTRPMVVTRGMFPDPVLPQGGASVSEASEKPPVARWKKGCLVALLVFGGLAAIGGISALLFLRHQKQVQTASIEAGRAAIARAQSGLASQHANIQKGVADMVGFEAQANALVTQAVALVEQELGDTYTARVLEPPPPPPEPVLPPDAMTDHPDGTATNAPDATPAAVATNALPGLETGEVPAPEVEAEPLPPLAQMARDVYQEALPLKQALTLAQELAQEADAVMATTRSATNTLGTLEAARRQLEQLTVTLGREHASAPQTLAATRTKLDALASEVRRLTGERERAEAEARQQAAAREAAEAEARQQAELIEAIRAETSRIVVAVETRKEALMRHQYAQVLRELRDLEGGLRHEEGRQALALAIQRVTCLQELRDFMVKRLGEVPYRDAAGWSVETAGPRKLTIRAANGTVSNVPWESVNNRVMAGFIRFYIHDERQSRTLRLRERHAQTINAIVYTLTFGEGSDEAMSMVRTLGQRVVDMMPSEREATLRLIPELTKLID